MPLKIILAQLNFTVGDIRGNVEKIKKAVIQAEKINAHLIVFPEMALSGYPPEDLVYRDYFLKQIQSALEVVQKCSGNLDMLIGYPQKKDHQIFNAAAWFRKGQLIKNYHKQKLPNYSVFDEERYFTSGKEHAIVEINQIKCGILICEDIWYSGPVAALKKAGAELIICINASPYSVHKAEIRTKIMHQRMDESGLPICYLNTVGGQDELVFDGGSFAIDAQKKIFAQAKYFEEELLPVEFPPIQLSVSDTPVSDTASKSCIDYIYKALVLGTKDYVTKNGFHDVVIGLSGGIDSSLTLAIAVDALGADHVHALLMPSHFTRSMSIEDAKIQAQKLGIEHHLVPIQPIYEIYLSTLKPFFKNKPFDTTEENLQARIRGMLLMAFSNKFGYMVLTTGNKSETAVGYVTLYGDMVGGFAPLKDVSKTLVYELAAYRNSIAQIIPQRVFERAPSAELAPDQMDEDSLPPYKILDPILALFVEKDLDTDQIVADGFDKKTVEKVIKMVLNNEYKRRQGPPGIRITEKAFGRDRRYPITSKYLK